LASLGVSLDERGSGQSDSVGCEPRHCASKDTLSEPDLAHVCKCVLGQQQYPGSPIVKVNINNTSTSNILVNLGASINIITKETMEKLQFPGLRLIPTILQLVDRSTVKPEVMLEAIIVFVDLWEYLDNFMVMQPKAT
jgi:hypothetical protein